MTWSINECTVVNWARKWRPNSSTASSSQSWERKDTRAYSHPSPEHARWQRPTGSTWTDVPSFSSIPSKMSKRSLSGLQPISQLENNYSLIYTPNCLTCDQALTCKVIYQPHIIKSHHSHLTATIQSVLFIMFHNQNPRETWGSFTIWISSSLGLAIVGRDFRLW